MIAMKGKILSISLALLLIMGIAAPMADGLSKATDVTIHLNGPSVLGTLRSGTYLATMVDPQNREWGYRVFITADNMTGASPLKDTPVNGTVSADNSTFTFDVTAQQEPGELDIHINCTTGTMYYEKVQTIYVVSPVMFSVDINNPSNVDINNATVQFFVDGTSIDEKTTNIAAMQTTVVTSEWISNDKDTGWHTSRITVDLNGDGTVDTSLGDLVIEDRFYIEGGSNWMFGLAMLAIGLLAIFLGFAYISKQKMK